MHDPINKSVDGIVAVHCGALQRVAVSCSMLQCDVVCCNESEGGSVLKYVVVCCGVLQSVAVCCKEMMDQWLRECEFLRARESERANGQRDTERGRKAEIRKRRYERGKIREN